MEMRSEVLALPHLENLLQSKGIDLSKWGIGEAKTTSDLLAEIESGETTLTSSEAGEFLRTLNAIAINVHFTNPTGQKFILREDRQEFDDGRPPRIRTYLDGSVAGKMKRDEDPLLAAKREFQEELGIEDDVYLVLVDQESRISSSQSYPGLKTQYTLYLFKTNLTGEQFNPEGYQETDGRLTTFFVWDKVT